MSSQVELCEHHAKDCLQAAEKTEDPLGARDASQACAGVAAGRACSIQAIEAVSCLWTQGSTGIEPGTLRPLPDIEIDGGEHQCLMNFTAWTRPRRLALEPR